MKAIYQPKGKAAEYGKYAVNLYSGCTHGCKYCYVPGLLRMSREKFHSGFILREGILEQLDKDAAKHPKDEPVFLSFTSDPYQPGAKETTREALKILNKHGINWTILTKGGMIAVIDDFDLYKEGDSIGVTLTTTEESSLEPWAASPANRLNILAIAKEFHIKNWVSFEPCISADQTLKLLTMVCDGGIVDHVKIGACSGPHSTVNNWFLFGKHAESICIRAGVSYYLKEDLRRRMGILPEVITGLTIRTSAAGPRFELDKNGPRVIKE